MPKERAAGVKMSNQRQMVKRLEVKVNPKSEVEVKAAEDPKHSFTYFLAEGTSSRLFLLAKNEIPKKGVVVRMLCQN